MHSLLGKRVAKKLKVLRYIPERRVYELSVEWQSQAAPATFFLSEVFLYPYALHQSQSKSENIVTTVALEPTFNTNHKEASNPIKMIPTSSPKNDAINEKFSQAKFTSKKQLDYDRFLDAQLIQVHVERRNRDIVLHHRQNSQIKKRKQ